jgi:hypothetical protein
VTLRASELAEVFLTDMATHPRTLQEALGPSEIGDSCPRKLAYKVLGVPPVETGPRMGLPAWIGTSAHAGAEKAFKAENRRLRRSRWITESRVDVGKVLDLTISGTCDLYDTDNETVVDFKFIGPTSLRKYKMDGLSDVYRTQVHAYGQGMVNAGRDVQDVSVYLVPRDGHLSSAVLISEPFDPAMARRALKRLEGIVSATRVHGREALPLFPMAASYCRFCPWHLKDSLDPRVGCPGVADQPMSNSTQNTLTFSV